MSKLREVKQTKDAKQQYKHPIIEMLLTEEPLTKDELKDKLHATSEREVRDIISTCAMHYPVIAVSNKRGYRRAKNIDSLDGNKLIVEMDEVQQQLNELKSRVACLKKRMRPLVAWLKVAEKKLTQE